MYLAPITHARASDPGTSRHAAGKLTFASGQCGRILADLGAHGLSGAEEIAARLNLPAYSIRKRLADLADHCKAQATAHTRSTSTGRLERLWVALA